MEDIKQKIIDYLSMKGSCNMKELLQVLGGRVNKVIEAKDLLVKEGKIEQMRDIHDTRKINLNLRRPQPNLSLNAVMSSLSLAEERVEEYMKKLRQSKPLFEPINEFKDGETTKFKIKPKNRKILDKIIDLLNDLISRSVALTYAECLDLLPKGSSVKIRQYHRECIMTIRRIMDNLLNEHKDSELALGTHLYYRINGYGHLTTLEYLSKRTKK